MMSPAARGMGCDNLRSHRVSPYPYQRPTDFSSSCQTYYRDSSGSPPYMGQCIQNTTWPLHHLNYVSPMTLAQMKPDDVANQTMTSGSFSAPTTFAQFPTTTKTGVEQTTNPWGNPLSYPTNI